MKSIFETITELEKTRTLFAICTIIDSKGSTPRSAGSRMVVTKTGQLFGTVGGGEVERRAIEAAHDSMKSNKPINLSFNMVNPEKGDPGICGGSVQIYIEPITPTQEIVIIGNGHVGRSVAHLAKWLGFYVTMVDDRQMGLDEELLKDIDHNIISEITNFKSDVVLNEDSIVIITTRDHEIDIKILPHVLSQKTTYVGVIGSRRRWKLTREKLIEQGISLEQLEKVYSPIGLDIGAQTPNEIAVSIMSEVLKTTNKNTGNSMRG